MKSRLIFAIGMIICFSCKNHQAASAESQPTVVETPQVETTQKTVETQPGKLDSLFLSFEKTPCFGRCPVYKVKIYKSGFATFEGLNFTERMGLYSTTFSAAEMAQLTEMAKDVKFVDFEKVYDDPNITDLPSTYTSIRIDGELKTIKARTGIPKDLKAFNENLSVTLTEKTWKPFSDY